MQMRAYVDVGAGVGEGEGVDVGAGVGAGVGLHAHKACSVLPVTPFVFKTCIGGQYVLFVHVVGKCVKFDDFLAGPATNAHTTDRQLGSTRNRQLASQSPIVPRARLRKVRTQLSSKKPWREPSLSARPSWRVSVSARPSSASKSLENRTSKS